MGVPKRKVAHARQMERRSHLALTLPKLVECPHCHEPKLLAPCLPGLRVVQRPPGDRAEAGRRVVRGRGVLDTGS